MARILIVDDEKLARMTVRQMLEGEGHEIHDAGDGQAALEQLTGTHVDVVVTDIIMPEKEGIQTIIELRREFPDVKIIAMSGGGRVGNVDFLSVAKDIGAVHVLRKPFRQAELLEAVNDCLVGGEA